MLLVLANGFFVATEFSLVSVRRTRMQQLATGGSHPARAVLDRLDHLDTYIAATQLGITMASIGLGWIGEPALAHLIEPAIDRLSFLSEGTRETLKHTMAFALAFSVITALHIVFGELAPKSLALQRPEATSLAVAGPIYWFNFVFRPVVNLLNGVGNAVVRLAGIQPAGGHAMVQSADELMLSVQASREAGLVQPTAHELVRRAFTFTEFAVRKVMVPRTEMTAVPVESELPELLRVAAESGHMRLPVYDENIDNIVGIAYVKRLLPLVHGEPGAETAQAVEQRFDLKAYLAEPLVVPETAPAAEVLNRLRQSGTQIAVVIDEYGGTAGVVTLEDLVEGIIGEIEEEFGTPEGQVLGPADEADLIDGLMSIVEARERFGLDLSEEQFHVETVGGYVFSALGQRPVIGDEVSLPGGLVLRVEELDGLRIARLRLLAARSPFASREHAEGSR